MTDVVRARSGGVEIETKQGPFHSGGASIVDKGNREKKGEGRTKNWLRRRSGVSLAPFFLSEAVAHERAEPWVSDGSWTSCQEPAWRASSVQTKRIRGRPPELSHHGGLLSFWSSTQLLRRSFFVRRASDSYNGASRGFLYWSINSNKAALIQDDG
ncbi:hypothetical protein BJX65DRAFT_125547 [Aspergillus insuetus]